MLERALERDPSWEPTLVSLHPIGRLGGEQDVVNAVLWLCAEASFVTGHALAVDGAITVV